MNSIDQYQEAHKYIISRKKRETQREKESCNTIGGYLFEREMWHGRLHISHIIHMHLM